jgi:hypothetical protein
MKLIQKVMTGSGEMREGRLDVSRPVDAGMEPALLILLALWAGYAAFRRR